MSKTTNKFAPEVRERAIRMVMEHEGDHPSRWAAIISIAEKIGCSGHTLLEWVKKFHAPAPNMLWVSDLASPPFGSRTSRRGRGSSTWVS